LLIEVLQDLLYPHQDNEPVEVKGQDSQHQLPVYALPHEGDRFRFFICQAFTSTGIKSAGLSHSDEDSK
jgi:hypothetical protein